MRNGIEIKILKAKNDVLWYRNKIGEQFTVKEEKGKNYYTAKSSGNKSKIIYKEDCKLI